MYSFLVLVLTVSLVSADVGLGYNYKPPSPTFPTYQASSSSGQYNIGYNNANGNNYKLSDQADNQAPGYAFQSTANNVYQASPGYQSFKPAVINNDAFGSQSTFQSTVNKYQGVYNGGNTYRDTAAYQGQSVGSYGNLNTFNKEQSFQSTYDVKYQEPQIFKHFYIHAAPEEAEAPKPRTPLVLPPAQKHYKVIFIKAPSESAGAPQYIPVPQQNEEKTIVYVLVNKPEEAQNVVLPKVEQKAPSKPEVYFIKYNKKEGTQAVIDNIVKDYNKGQSVSFANIGTGVTPPASLLGSFGTSGTQVVDSVNAGSSGLQNVVSSGFESSSTEYKTESGLGSKPLGLNTAGISDGTLASTFIGTGSTTASKVDNEYNSNVGFNSGSSSTGFSVSGNSGLNGVSGSSGFNGASGNSGFSGVSSDTGFSGTSSSTGFNGATSGTGFNGAISSTGFNGASSNTGVNGASSNTGFTSSGNSLLNSESGGSGYTATFGNGFAGGSNTGGSIEYSTSGIPLVAASITDSEYKGSTISTSQGVPHETYGVPKFRA